MHRLFVLFVLVSLVSPLQAQVDFEVIGGQKNNKKTLKTNNYKQARRHLDNYLKKRDGHVCAQIHHLSDPSLQAVFPGHVFFSVHYQCFPQIQKPGHGLKTANVLAISRHGELQLLCCDKSLTKFFKAHYRGTPKTSHEAAGNVMKAWLALSPELKQDGHYRFLRHVHHMQERGPHVHSIIGSAIVNHGGQGMILTTIDFDHQGAIQQVMERNTLRANERP